MRSHRHFVRVNLCWPILSTGIVCAAALAGAVLIFAGTSAVHSQDVSLVTVDVSLVGQGYRASKLMGKSVVNEKNESAVSNDLVFARDKSLYAVLQVGVFLGLGSRLIAVPCNSLKVSENASAIKLPGASKDQLQKLTEFKYLT